jgi:hypothetical protein
MTITEPRKNKKEPIDNYNFLSTEINQRMKQYCAVPNITDIDSSSSQNNRTATGNAHEGSQPHHSLETNLSGKRIPAARKARPKPSSECLSVVGKIHHRE